MKDMVQLTGGVVVQIDTFKNVVFKESLKRQFAPETDEGFLGLCSNASLEVIPSRDIKVSGLLGPAARLDKKGPAVAETEVGGGGQAGALGCAGLGPQGELGRRAHTAGRNGGLPAGRRLRVLADRSGRHHVVAHVWPASRHYPGAVFRGHGC